MEAKIRHINPLRTSTSTDFGRDSQIYGSSHSSQIALKGQKHVSTKEKSQRPIKAKPNLAPKIAIHEATSYDVNKSGAGNVKKVEDSKVVQNCSSEEEMKGQDFHLSVKDDERDSDEESSLVRSDCLHEDDLVHLAEQVKVQEEEENASGFVPKTVDEADQMGALDDFLLDNEGDDYVPPTMDALHRKQTIEMNRQVTGGSLMSQESAKLVRTKGSVNEKAKNMEVMHDYNKLKNERERAQQLFRECLDVQLLGKDCKGGQSAYQEEDSNIMLLRATRTEGSANLVEIVSHLQEAELNNGRGSKSPKISTFKKSAQKKLSRPDLLHVMYKIPKHMTYKKETEPVLKSKARKQSRMGKTLGQKSNNSNLNPHLSRNERANLSSSLNPKAQHKHNKSFNMYEVQPKRSTSRLPQKQTEPLLCKTPQVQFVAKFEPPKPTPPKKYSKTMINPALLTPSSVGKNKKKEPANAPKQTQSSNRVNMFLDFDLEKKKNHWKEVYEIPSQKMAKIYSKRVFPSSKILQQTQFVSEAMTSSISPRTASPEKSPTKKPASPIKTKNSRKSPSKSVISKSIYSLKPKSKKVLLANNRKKISRNEEELKKIESSDSDDFKRASTNSEGLEKQVTEKSSFYEIQRSISLLEGSSSEDNRSESSTGRGKKGKIQTVSSFGKPVKSKN